MTDESITVHFVDHPPKGSTRINARFYRDRTSGVTYQLWRGRWTRVTDTLNTEYAGELLWAIDRDRLPFTWEKWNG